MLLLLACTARTPDTGDSSAPPFVWPSEGWVLDDVTVVDGTGARPDQAIVVAGDSIWAVVDAGQSWPEQLRVEAGEGAFVIPGLIDSHTHLAYSGALSYVGDFVAENLAATLHWGVVGVVDVGGPTWTWRLRDGIASGQIRGPRMLATGPFITAEGSHPCELVYDRELCVFVDGDAGETGQALLDQGADGLKVALSEVGVGTTWPRLDLADLAELTALDATVFVHVATAEDAQDAAAATHLAHTPFASAMSSLPPVASLHSTVGANAGILWTDPPDTVPPEVLATWNRDAYPQWQEAAAIWTAQLRDNLAWLVDQGAPLVAGSDAGYYFVPHGWALHLELQELVAAGMSPQQAIAAATSEPAAIYGFEGLGCVDAGCEASFLVLDEDPLQDIANTLGIRQVVHQGEPLDPTPPAGDDGFCLEDADCSSGLCNVVNHACAPACQAWSALNDCEESWCAPVSSSGEGVCHEEFDCDWAAQDCSAYYAETCVPADLDNGYCWPSGPRGLQQSCSYDDPATRCGEGLFCSPISWVCLEFCQHDSDCSSGSCNWEKAGDQDWFGLCY